MDRGPDLPGYTWVKLLGRGGFADVHLYEQHSPPQRVAVKVLRSGGIDASIRAKFEAEANAMAKLAGHPYIVPVFRNDVAPDGRPYMVMKYYPQRNLAVRARAERIPVADVLQIGVRIASAVETAHRAGILHRDIKPANILTSGYGEPGLTDFGIATVAGQGDADEAEGMSIPWSPPEILFGHSQGDRLSDVYSLGATLWHLLAGRSPFEDAGGDNTTVALLRRIKEQPPPRTGRPDVPASLERVLSQAMSKREEDRPQSALELARSLQAVEGELQLAPTPLTLEDEPVVETPDAPASDGDTRRSQPVVVDPVGSATQRKLASVDPAGPRPQRERQGIPGLDDGRTQRKAQVIAPVTPEEPVATEPRTLPRWVLAAAAAAAVVVIVVVGVVVTAGSKSSPPVSTTLPDTAPTAAPPVDGVPIVSSVRVSPTVIRYSWTDPGAQPGDSFVVSVDNGPYASNGASRTKQVTVPANGRACVAVEIVRDGATSSPGQGC